MLSKYAMTVVMAILVCAIVSVGCGQSMSRTYVYKNSSKQGWLGVEVQDVSKRLKGKKHFDVNEGAYVTRVVEESPAEEAGIEEGDVIVKFDGKTIDDSNDLIRSVRRTKPKTEVKIDIVRKTEHKTVSAVLRRTSTPQAFSFNFGDKDFTPRIPRMPMQFHMFSVQQFGGLSVQSLTKQLGEYFDVPEGKGVLVTEVRKGSSSAEAGFKAGDIITKVNKNSISDMDDFREELSNNQGKENTFDILRKGKTMTLTMKSAEDDDEDDDDYSDNTIIIPDAGHQWRMFHGETFPFDHSELSRLKENLKEMGTRFKERLHHLRETLERDLHNL